MIVMPSNNNAMYMGYLAGRFPGKIGHLYSPGGLRGPYDFLPFALDNGRYASTTKGIFWSGDEYLGMLDRVAESGFIPRWVLVPDVVGDPEATLRSWDAWASRLKRYGWPLAFAVQDGMDFDELPDDTDVVFVGGTTEWKRATLHDWCLVASRVHVGRINTNKWLWEAHEAGAESCDGTGWMRGDKQQLAGLVEYLETSTEEGAARQRGLFARSCLRCHRHVPTSYAECPRCHVPVASQDRRKGGSDDE